MSFIHLLSASLTFSRWHIIVLILIVFLPVIPLITTRPRPLVITQQPTTSAGCSVVIATSTAQRRVIAQPPMTAARLGNTMFVYASALGIAARNELAPLYHCDVLERIFHVTATGSYVINPPAISVVEDSALRYVRYFAFLVLRFSFGFGLAHSFARASCNKLESVYYCCSVSDLNILESVCLESTVFPFSRLVSVLGLVIARSQSVRYGVAREVVYLAY